MIRCVTPTAGNPAALDDQIIARYAVLHDAYLAQRSLIPAGRLHELSYDGLSADPVVEMRRLTIALDIPWAQSDELKLQQYLDSISDYQKNRHVGLSDLERQRVAEAWEVYFHALGNPTEDHSQRSETTSRSLQEVPR